MDYEVIRSNRRSLSLEVRADGSLLVRAPKRLGAAEVRRFVQSKEAWIQEKQAALARGERAFGGGAGAAESTSAKRFCGKACSVGTVRGGGARALDHSHPAHALGQLLGERRH
ncbi:MAG: YgjP-like metallopeptidase domain-containing protein [Peptococcaceae bacterium]|nr:YgjP-like metallopeptidase domain-containing protein [Peptococcaceae bacterium]